MYKIVADKDIPKNIKSNISKKYKKHPLILEITDNFKCKPIITDGKTGMIAKIEHSGQIYDGFFSEDELSEILRKASLI